jgi:hypothetical protein
MIDQSALEVAMCKFVMAATGLAADKVIVGDPDAGSPAGSYCAIRLQNPEVFGQAMKSQSDVAAEDNSALMDLLDRTATQLVLSFSVNFYRNGAMGCATSLLEAHRRFPVQAVMRQAGLGWQRASPVNNLTGLQSASMEERAQLTLYLYAQDVVEDRVNRVYQVEYAVSDESERTLIQGKVNGLPG